MAKNSVADWSPTAAENTDLGGISLAENVMRPPAVNDAFREMMAQIKSDSTAARPIAAGGTGATTAAGALTNLGVSSFVQGALDETDGNNFFTALGGVRDTSAQGYTTLPNGIIVQWGSGSIDAGTIDFPLAFPSACRSVVATTNANGARMPAVDDITATSFSLRMFDLSGAASSAGYNYIAIGY